MAILKKSYSILFAILLAVCFLFPFLDNSFAQVQAPGHAHCSLPVSLNAPAQITSLSIPAVLVDEQIGLTFDQNFTSLAYNVSAVAQSDSYGYGPGYLLNGLSNDGYWYQVGLAYNWPYQSGGYVQGFYLSYEVWNSAGQSIYPTSGGGLQSFSGPVNPGDLVLLNLYFSNGIVYMYGKDWTTGSTSTQSYSNSQTTSFIGLSSSWGNNNGFFTGPMTEWWHVNPYYGSELQVTYSDNSFPKSYGWLWMDEWEPSNPSWSGTWSYGLGVLTFSANPIQLQSFANNGAQEYGGSDDFITGQNAGYLIVQGSNNLIYYNTFNATSNTWASWSKVPGSTIGSPAAVVCGNELYTVVRGSDGNTLWFSSINLTNGIFSGWQWISGSSPSAPTLVSNGTALTLVVRGADNSVYYRKYNIQTSTWGPWNAFPGGSTCDQIAATIQGNILTVVLRGFSSISQSDNDTLWQASINQDTGAFSGWTWIPGSVTSSPTLAAMQDPKSYCLVVRGQDNSIYIKEFTGSSWSGWIALQQGATYQSPAATVIGNQLYLVVVGTDGTTLWQGNLNLNTITFSGWTWLSGNTPSKPLLTS